MIDQTNDNHNGPIQLSRMEMAELADIIGFKPTEEDMRKALPFAVELLKEDLEELRAEDARRRRKTAISEFFLSLRKVLPW